MSRVQLSEQEVEYTCKNNKNFHKGELVNYYIRILVIQLIY